MDGVAIVVVGVVGGGVSVLVSPRVGSGGGTGPGVLGSAIELPLNATVSAPMVRTLVAPAVAAASFNLVLFTLDHSNRFNWENAYEEVSGNPFEGSSNRTEQWPNVASGTTEGLRWAPGLHTRAPDP